MNSNSRLKEAVKLLSLPAEEQIDYLRRIGFTELGGADCRDNDIALDVNIDELALQFEDEYIRINSLDLPERLKRLISHLDSILLAYSGERFSAFWTVRALINDSRWEDIRNYARVCFEGFETGS